jgi:hypothetical protein
VNRLHGREVTREGSVVGTYLGNNQRATLYLTEFDAESEADSTEGRMSEAIRKGDYGFNHLHPMEFKGEPVSACIGHGQIHFFFADGNRLYWLSADYPVAVEAVNDLLASRGR